MTSFLLPFAPDAHAQRTVEVTGDRLGGFVLPIEPLQADVRLEALRGTLWTVDDTKRLFLQGDVEVEIGGFAFTAPAAVVWINRLPTARGVVSQVAVYFENVRNSEKLAGYGAAGTDLLVTGSARGEVTLELGAAVEVDDLNVPPVRAAEARLAAHLSRLLREPPPLHERPQVEGPIAPAPPAIVPGREPVEVAREVAIEPPGRVELPPATDEPALPIFRPEGTIAFSAGRIETVSSAEETAVVALDDVVVEYVDPTAKEFAHLTLTAERAVIFTDPDATRDVGAGFTAESVRGIYLEGNVVASTSDYTVRGARVYYDVRHDRAILLDAILRTYSARLGRPVYVRAAALRQLAAEQWAAEKAVVSASEFFTPHLAVGVDRVTVTQRPALAGGGAEAGAEETYLEAEDATLRVAGTPVLWWPRFAGTLENVPLRSISAGTEDDGFAVHTAWDVYAVLGRATPPGTDLLARVDLYADRGPAPALGVDYLYAVPGMVGDARVWGMVDDGTDTTSSGREVPHEDDWRGVALWSHRQRLSEDLDLQAQLSAISDETLISALFEEEFEERRPFETSVYLNWTEAYSAFTALASYDLTDFISNGYLLASRQYEVEKLPELTYRRFLDELFDGAITHLSETSYARVRLSFEEHTPRELGVPAEAFGVGDDKPLVDLFRDRGFPTSWVNRFDTRHELIVPGRWGIFNLDPFLVGRVTAYDEEFDEFSSDAENVRYFGMAGVRMSTQFQRVYNGVDNRLLDLHRLRHIVEPVVTLWYAESNVDQFDLPTFDEGVESIATGAAAKFGLINTLQTQRGGPGRWRSVDVFTLHTSLILASDDSDRESAIPRYFDFRPEYSRLADHVEASAVWAVSDSLHLAGEAIYDLDEDGFARGAIGAELIHSPLLRTYLEYRAIEPYDARLLDFGVAYRLTPKYRVIFSPQWDLRRNEFRALDVDLVRSFPSFDFIVELRYDEIKDETSLGATLGAATF